ncbi:MAG: CRISPR-associated protein Cas2 [Spirochaetales bacterium]|nr:CRISPR-associated protein Cas2 [Spirochaetales bacterium]
MFVAIACDLGSEDHSQSVDRVLVQYGLKRVQERLYESVTLSPEALPRLKKELDRVTDGYDALRIYQYPLEGGLVVSSLKEKKWRKTIVSSKSAER